MRVLTKLSIAFLFTLLPGLTLTAASASTDATPAPAATADEDGDDWDDEDDADLDELLDSPIGGGGGWEEEKKPRTFPWFEHHGYFRFRSDLFWRGHLGTDPAGDAATTNGTSGLLPPLSHNSKNEEDEDVGRSRDDDTLASANMRFRYEPTIHLSSDLRIHAQFDVLDNIVLGSTPNFAVGRVDTPLVVLSDGTVPPESGRTTFQDSIRVKQAYGEWRSLLGLLRFGRQAEHWGLGMYRNGGFDPDSDFGDYVDRVSWMARFYGVYAMVAWDFASEGPTSASAGDFYGQPYDLDQADDVNQWVFSIFQRPVTAEEIALRRKDLDERRVPVLDWGFYNLFRIQDLDLPGTTLANAPTPGTDAWDDAQYVQRDAWVWTPDLWLRFEWRPRYGRKLHIEMEAVFAYGAFDAEALAPNADGVLERKSDKRDILQYGGVIQADYTMGGLSFGGEFGIASGDDDQHFGVLDQSNLFDDDGEPNKKLTAFVFDRDYHVDLLLYREVIGAVTNSWYLKPFVQYDLFEGEEDALGVRFDMLYARALEEDATPGQDPNLGVELDLRLFYEEQGRFLATLEWGILFPLDGLDLAKGYPGYSGDRVSSKWATSIQARIHWMF